MEKEKIEKKLQDLFKEYELKRKAAIREYCDANNPYKVGDVFEDRQGKIKIEKIGYNYSQSFGCIYYGIELKKDGTPKKIESKRPAWQSNDIKINPVK